MRAHNRGGIDSQSTIFISHSSKDNDLAKEVERRLAYHHHHSSSSISTGEGIVAGQSWERTLYRKLRACRAVIALYGSLPRLALVLRRDRASPHGG
jgi:hypothetical protein